MQSDNKPDHASIATELEATRHELARAIMERDFALRLLRRQQYLNAGYVDDAEKRSIIIRLLRRVPKNIANLFSVRFRQFVKRVILWAR